MECSNYERNWFHLCFTSAKCAVREACLQHKSAATVKRSGCLSDDTQLDDKRLQSGILAWFNKHKLSRTDNLIMTGTISCITWICRVGLNRKCQKQSIFRITHSILGKKINKKKGFLKPTFIWWQMYLRYDNQPTMKTERIELHR